MRKKEEILKEFVHGIDMRKLSLEIALDVRDTLDSLKRCLIRIDNRLEHRERQGK